MIGDLLELTLDVSPSTTDPRIYYLQYQFSAATTGSLKSTDKLEAEKAGT
jgi:hypothetical protein